MNIADIKDESLKAALRQVKAYCLKHSCVGCELDGWCDEVSDGRGIYDGLCSIYDREAKSGVGNS